MQVGRYSVRETKSRGTHVHLYPRHFQPISLPIRLSTLCPFSPNHRHAYSVLYCGVASISRFHGSDVTIQASLQVAIKKFRVMHSSLNITIVFGVPISLSEVETRRSRPEIKPSRGVPVTNFRMERRRGIKFSSVTLSGPQKDENVLPLGNREE